MWRRIKGFDDYLISILGDVYSNKSNKMLKQQVCTNGYIETKLLDKNNKRVHKRIHRLVAETFIPNSENKPEVNHIDGDITNNHVENLEWCTRKENMNHCFKNISSQYRNMKKCKLYVDNYLIKEFDCKKDAIKYAVENYYCSKSSLTKYNKSQGIKVCE